VVRINPVNSIASVLAAAALLAAGSVAGQEPTDAERCASIANNPDLAIAHCTKAIESGRHSGADQARLFLYRGVERAAKSDYDRAISDYDAAIRLDPKTPNAFHNRGSAWANKGEPDRAIADYDTAIRLSPKEASAYSGRAVEWMVKGEYARAAADFDTAIRLDPKSANAFLGRGRVRFYSGDFQRAASDLDQAHKLEPNPYTALWTFLARKRGGADAEEVLDRETRSSRGAWPATVIVLYLGRTDPASVIAASTHSDPKTQRHQRCEANFYVAQWHLLRGERERARPLLKEVQDTCPRNFMEYEGALAELRRLQLR